MKEIVRDYDPMVTRRRLAGVIGVLFLAAAATAGSFPAEASISDVSVSRAFFNPSLGQKIQISMVAESGGTLNLWILDRDGYLVRKLVSSNSVQKGRVVFDWDGRDDRGNVVPDEAYSVKIDLDCDGESFGYFPGNQPAEKLKVTAYGYDRPQAVLSYRLSRPARVHVQVGVTKTDSKTGLPDGPVLKTVVNREPRPAGPVIENWNGFDESGAFYVPDLPDFAVAIVATSLPENAIITFGSRKVSFLDTVASRSGASLFTFAVAERSHHNGLMALDDVAPRLRAEVVNASWSAVGRIWSTDQRDLQVSVSLTGPSAEAFAAQPAKLLVFMDGRFMNEVSSPRPGMTVRVTPPRAVRGTHMVALNWVSAYGPVAVDSFRVVWTGGVSSPTASVTQ